MAAPRAQTVARRAVVVFLGVHEASLCEAANQAMG